MAPVTSVATPDPKVVEPLPEYDESEAPAGKKVGIAICSGVGSDFLQTAILKALVSSGISGTVICQVDSVMMLPYTAQQMLVTCDAVIAAAVVTNDTIGSGSVSQAVINGLLHTGVVATKPLVPAVVCQSSLLELKAVLPTLSAGWAKSVLTLLTPVVIEKAPLVSLTPPPAPVTADVMSIDLLMADFKESLKVFYIFFRYGIFTFFYLTPLIPFKDHGASGIIGLGRKFKIADDDNSGTISMSEFEKVCSELTMHWSKAQTKLVFDFFDRDKNGQLSYDEFLVGVRGQLNDRRHQLVLSAFKILDSDNSGSVDINDIKNKFDASKHPGVIAGTMTVDEVLNEWLSTFEVGGKVDGLVTPDEFVHYYMNVSASIDDDDYFELMIRNAWHISGGEGWCANSSCRRVLVLHTDGRQTVEEIKVMRRDN